MKMKKTSFVAAAVLCTASASLFAQDKTNITGSLYDKTATTQYVGIAAGRNAKASAGGTGFVLKDVAKFECSATQSAAEI